MEIMSLFKISKCLICDLWFEEVGIRDYEEILIYKVC